ncbi:MAG: flagellar biosynthetic protein FliR [Legionellaceae bacterium]|nr:flagellar biosynthetic protein FliR [Legionellaceae bacterium]
MNLNSTAMIPIFLVTIRLGSLFMLTPLTPIRQLPRRVRLFLLIGLSAVLVSGQEFPALPDATIPLLIAGLAELINGLILSLSIFAVFSALSLAGLLIDSQMGLNATTVLNPQANSQEALSGHFLCLLALLLFFAGGSHRLLLQALSLSLQQLPPGTLLLHSGLAPALQQFAEFFVFGLMIAAPLVFSLLLLDLAMGMITRNMPQVSVYFVTLPLKILLGITILMLNMSAIGALFEKMFQQIFRQWQSLLT